MESSVKNRFQAKFIKLLYDSLTLKNKWDFQSNKHLLDRASIVQGLEYLLDNPPDKKHKELFTFYKRMCKESQHVFTFLFVADVPTKNIWAI